ncbi:hypothetical protein ACE1CD_15515 [Aerosakkonema sp. BLCC-F183]|uniref:hypothetical protein n=1 Tax=Aerosakkonema sp. BLCC-F183 TaxID=3342834 RepID=UPI0035B9939A
MGYQDIIDETSGWLGKGGLPILEDVGEAIESPMRWFESQDAVNYVMDDNSNIPTLTNSLKYQKPDVLASTISKSADSFLQTAYGTNKCFNSLKHKNLQAAGEAIAAKTRMSNRDKLNYRYAVNTYDFWLNCPDLQKRFKENPYQGRLADINSRIAQMQDDNKSWLERIVDAASNEVEDLTGAAKSKAKRLIKKLSKFLGRSIGSVNFTRNAGELIYKPYTDKPYTERFLPVALAEPTTMQTIGVVTNISGAIVKDFLIAPVLPELGIASGSSVGAIVNATSGVVSKNIAFTGGAEVSRYFAGQGLRQATSTLPAIWNATGTFTGAFGFLMAAAPYIILAATLVTLAIEMSKKTEVGHVIFIFGRREGANDFDLNFGKYSGGTQEQLLAKFLEMKQELLQETGKDYAEVYGFSFDIDKNHKLAMNMSSLTPLPMPKEQAEEFWQIISDSPIFDLFKD